MKNMSWVVLIVAVAGLAFAVVRQQNQIAVLKQALADKSSVERKVARDEAPPIVTPHRKIAPEARRAESTVAPGPVAAPKHDAPMVAAATNESNMRDFFSNVTSMMTNPAMKQMVRSQAKLQLEIQYARLFKFLNKSPEVMDTLKDMLMERQMALMDSGMAMMGGTLSPEERKNKAVEIQKITEGYDKKIEALLGADDFDAYKQYENTQPERMQVEMFKSAVASSGQPLTDQQEYDLVSLMYSARTNAPVVSSLLKTSGTPDPTQLTPETMDLAMKQSERVQSQYLAVASSVLSPAQYTQFQQFVEQQKQMREMGMKFAAQMFGVGKSNVQVSIGVGK